MRHKKQGLVIMLSTVATLLATTGRSAQAAPANLDPGCQPYTEYTFTYCYYGDETCPSGSSYIACDNYWWDICGTGWFSAFFQCDDASTAEFTDGCSPFGGESGTEPISGALDCDMWWAYY